VLAETTEGSFSDARARFERQFLVARLESRQWNVAEAAEAMGMSVATLYRYLQRHGLKQAPPEGGAQT
jgi:transcriptional regulator of acetoin/glycerol metabolism